MLSFRTMQCSERVGDLAATIGFRIGEERFVARIAGGRVHTERGDPDGTDAVFTGAPEAIAGAVYGAVPFEALAAAGALEVEGDEALARRFATFFPLPPKVGP